MWFKKKEPPKVKKMRNNLIIRTKRETLYYSVDDHDVNLGPVHPWKSFYKWHFATKKPAFTFKVRDGEDTIIRDQIHGFKIVMVEYEEDQ